MASVNKVILIGNLGADPEMRYTPDGTAICRIRIATSEKYTDKAGNKLEKTEWHRITFWRKLAEICGQYLKKGSQVYVEGSLKNDTYEKDGVTRYSYDIQGRVMQMLGGRRGEDSQEEHAARGGSFEAPGTPEEVGDIPF